MCAYPTRCALQLLPWTLHPLRGSTPVTGQYTPYVALHPNREGALPTYRVHCLRIGCTAYVSGALPTYRVHCLRIGCIAYVSGAAPSPTITTAPTAEQALNSDLRCGRYARPLSHFINGAPYTKEQGLPTPTQNPGLDTPLQGSNTPKEAHTRCAPQLLPWTLHPLRGSTPVTWHYTRYGAVHPLRGTTPEQRGCTAYVSGALLTYRVQHPHQRAQRRT